MNSSMCFSALTLFCALPTLTFITALAGKDIAHAVIIRLGLNANAAADVNRLIAPTSNVLTTLTVFGVAWGVSGALAITSTLQEWYQGIFGLTTPRGVVKVLAYRFVWILIGIGTLWGVVLIGKEVSPSGGRVLSYALQFVVAVLFWSLSAYLLLVGKIGWRETLSAGVATGFCLTGLHVFSSLFFSNGITSGYNS
jgi:hypothetical protein